MIYLDYAANTPVDREVLQVFCEAATTHIANSNSTHRLGRQAKESIDNATKNIANCLGVKPEEIIYTSGATEANNLAIKGIAGAYKRYGKHIITSYLEHSSVTGAIASLQNEGYEVDYVNVMPDGSIDIEHLKELLREDTILVSIGYVDSEIGIIQSIGEIGEIISSYPNCNFHVDSTQAIGKIFVKLDKVDLVTFSPHKFYGLEASGVLIKKENIMLVPMINGGLSTTIYRGGTPNVSLALATEKAITLATQNIESRLEYVMDLNKRVRDELTKYKSVIINSTDKALPYILNISLKGINTNKFQDELELLDIYVSTKSACCAANTPSRPVYALTKDKKLALSTLRISFSHLTTIEEVNQFFDGFALIYNKLNTKP